jgi:ubiquinone biosynthesis protein
VSEETRTAPAWLSALGDALDWVEDTVWEVRRLADRVVAGWRDVQRDWNALAEDGRELAREAARLPDRSARLAATSWLVGQVALSYRLHAIRAAFLPEDAARDALEALHARNARRFQEGSARHGAGLLKIGQMLSARPDLLPPAWTRELAKLQDAAPSLPLATIRAVVEEDLGAELEALFAEFEPEPIGAASIAQVHRARMPDGELVAVKVRRPGVESLLDLDLGVLEGFVAAVRSLLPEADWEAITGEVRNAVSAELDFAREALVMDRLADFFADHPRIRVPRSRPERSGERVLTATFCEGRRIAEALDAWSAAREAGDAGAGACVDETLGLLLEAYLRMVLEAGVFQADPHPGNLLVAPDGAVVILDFGCSRELSPSRRRRYLALAGAAVAGRSDAAAEELDTLGFATRSGRPESLLAFAEALLGSFRRMAAGSEAWLSGPELEAELVRLLEAVRHDPVTMIPEDFVLLARVFGTLGGLFQHHRPRVDWGRHVAPVLGAALRGDG